MKIADSRSTSRPRDFTLSCVVPVYNEGETIAKFLDQLLAVIADITPNVEMVVVNDGSSDASGEQIQRLAELLPIHYIEFSRNFGKECALQAGLDAAQGDCVIVIDADFQHPVELIAEMVTHWRGGADMVYTVKADRQAESLVRRMASFVFYRLMLPRRGSKIPENAGDFRLLDRRLVEEIRRLPERTRFMKGLYAWVGFNTHAIQYRPAERLGGKTKFSSRRLTSLALTGITAFSTVPLRLMVFLGFLISLAAGVMGCWIVFEKLFLGQPVDGFTTLAAGMFFFAGIQLVAIGVVGEYVGRIFDEVKQRPLYVVAADVNHGPLARRATAAVASLATPLGRQAHSGQIEARVEHPNS